MGFKRFLAKNRGKVLVGLSTIGFAVFGFGSNIKDSGYKWFLKTSNGLAFSASTIAFIWGTLEEIKKNQNIDKLEQEINKLENIAQQRIGPIEISNILIESLSNHLNFSDSERIK